MACKALYGCLNILQAYLLFFLPVPLEIFALDIIDSTLAWITPFHLPEANLGGFSGISSLIRPSMPPALGLRHISQWLVISCLNIHFLPCSVSLGGQWCCLLITVIFPLAVKMPGAGKPSFFYLFAWMRMLALGTGLGARMLYASLRFYNFWNIYNF